MSPDAPTNAAVARPIERAIPVLTVLDVDAEIPFYARLGFEVQHRYDDDYVVLTRGDLEIHLAYWEDHDPGRTAGVVYLRVVDAQVMYDDLRARLERDGCLFLFPTSGSRATLWEQFERRLAAGTPTVRLHEIEDKPWGLRQFSVIDMSGNAIRVGHRLPATPSAP